LTVNVGYPADNSRVSDRDACAGADACWRPQSLAALRNLRAFLDVLVADAEGRELGFADHADRVCRERGNAT
jgi:hypothetical protein